MARSDKPKAVTTGLALLLKCVKYERRFPAYRIEVVVVVLAHIAR